MYPNAKLVEKRYCYMWWLAFCYAKITTNLFWYYNMTLIVNPSHKTSCGTPNYQALLLVADDFDRYGSLRLLYRPTDALATSPVAFKYKNSFVYLDNISIICKQRSLCVWYCIYLMRNNFIFGSNLLHWNHANLQRIAIFLPPNTPNIPPNAWNFIKLLILCRYNFFLN